jgi:hypothetical protein
MTMNFSEKPTHGRFIDLTGMRFGELRVVSYAGASGDGHSRWNCMCSCGNECTVIGKNAKRGKTTSCGCVHKKLASAQRSTHGDCGTRLHNIYNLMISRCCKSNLPSYKDYGGRGITVCDEWKSSYVAFRQWARTHGYEEHLTIERKDVDGSYCPENCCWITLGDQNHNKRNSKRLTAFGETKPLSLWVLDPRCSVNYRTIMSRLGDGWDTERAIGAPRLRPPRGVRKSPLKTPADC